MAVFKIEFLAILICLIALAHGKRNSPRITYITQEQIQDIGDKVDLECSVQNARDYPVLWVKYDSENGTESYILSSGTALVTRDNRLSLRYDDASGTYSLTMKDVQESDAGWYECQIVVSTKNRIKSGLKLQVHQPPVVSDNSTLVVVPSEGEEETRDVEPSEGTGVHKCNRNERIESTLARLEAAIAAIEASSHKGHSRTDLRNEATLARIEATLVRIEGTLVRVEGNQ